MSFYRTKRSEVRYNDKRKSHHSPVTAFFVSSRQFHNQNRINVNAQKGKLNFVRTSVRVLCLLIVRYTPPVPQIFSESNIINGVGGLFAVWMAQRIKHTTEGVKTLTAFKTLLRIHKTNVKIIIILLYLCLFGAWKLKSQIHNI